MAAVPPHKEEVRQFLELSIRQIKKLKVKIHLRSEVTPERLIQENPNSVVLATGGRPLRPQNIPRHNKMKCIYAWDILSGKEKNLGEKTVVLGGGFVGAEIADFIRSAGMAEEVGIVEMREAVAFDLEPAFRQLLIERLQKLGVKMLTHFRVREVTAQQVIGEDLRTKETKKIDADAVVIALGTESVNFPLEALQKKGIRVFLIGDAYTPRGIAEAVRDGYLAGISI